MINFNPQTERGQECPLSHLGFIIQSHSISGNEHKFLEMTHMFGYLACINLLELPSQSDTQPEWLKQQNASFHSTAGEKSKNQHVSRWVPPEGLERRTCSRLLLLTCRFCLLLMSSYECIFPLSLSVSMFKFPLLIKTPVILDYRAHPNGIILTLMQRLSLQIMS